MAKKFSLETVLSLTDGITGPIKNAQASVTKFSKTIQKHFGGVGKDITKASKAIDKMALAFGAAAVAGAAAGVAIIQSTASSADAFIKQARLIGVTSEELQALTYAADLQGVSTETLNKSLEKMMKNVGELRNGEGQLGKYLASTDQALLEQIQSATSSEQVFTLLMGKIGGMTDEFARAQFAQLAFGKSGMDMIKMANGGSDAIVGLLDEAHKYGLITDAASESSEVFLDEQARLKAMLLGMKNQVFNALIPKLADVATGIREMLEGAKPGAGIIDKLKAAIEGIDPKKVVADIKQFTDKVVKTISGITRLIDILSPLAPYLLGIGIAIKVVSAAILIMNAAAMASPVTWIILAIVAAIAAVIVIIKLLIDNWDAVSAAGVAAFNFIKEGIISVGATILSVVLAPLEMVLRLIAKIPGMAGKLAPVLSFMDKAHEKSLFGKKGAQSTDSMSAPTTYAEPSTYASESRSYSETRSTSEVFVRPDRGAAVSATRGGAPSPSLSYGNLQ